MRVKSLFRFCKFVQDNAYLSKNKGHSVETTEKRTHICSYFLCKRHLASKCAGGTVVPLPLTFDRSELRIMCIGLPVAIIAALKRVATSTCTRSTRCSPRRRCFPSRISASHGYVTSSCFLIPVFILIRSLNGRDGT